MRQVFSLFLGFVAILALNSPARAADAEQDLQAFFRQYLDEHFALRPLDASRLGDHRFDNLLEDVSKASRERWLEHDRKILKELPRRVAYSKLSRAGQIDFEIFQHDLERGIWSSENFKPFEEDPRVYGEYINDSVYTLLTQSTAPRETNVANA